MGKNCGNKYNVSYTQYSKNEKSNQEACQVKNIFDNIDYLNIRFNDDKSRTRIQQCYYINSKSHGNARTKEEIIGMFAVILKRPKFIKRNLLIEKSWESLEKVFNKFKTQRIYFDAGYVYAPYIPITNLPVELPEVFAADRSIRSKYALNPLNRNYYGNLVVGTQPVQAGWELREEEKIVPKLENDNLPNLNELLGRLAPNIIIPTPNPVEVNQLHQIVNEAIHNEAHAPNPR